MTNFRINNRYEIKEELGKGGMGVVYKAFDEQRRGFVAIKTLRDAADPAGLKLFQQEWITLANLSHPNIVDLFDSGEFHDTHEHKPFFVMPLLNGKTLEAVIRESPRNLSPELVVDLLDQACRGLDAAHAAGLIHRDLKPSNLFVVNRNALKIIDFGMVHLVNSQRSMSGLKGTLPYMSPEQLDGKQLTPAADIFSLGIVAYEALTGKNPFNLRTESAIRRAIRDDFPPLASDVNPSVNNQLARVIAKALAKSPWSRFSGAAEFGEYLKRSLTDKTLEIFERSRTLPRMEKVRQAVNEGEYEYAQEMLRELRSEGHADSDITSLSDKANRGIRSKRLNRLLDAARTWLKEDEYSLALKKVQEAIEEDPENAEAHALQAEIDTRRNDRQIERLRQLITQHLHANAFAQARQALEEIRKIQPDSPAISTLNADLDRRERLFRRVREEKEREYEAALDFHRKRDLDAAVSKLRRVIDPDDPEVAFLDAERIQVFRDTYNKIKLERDRASQSLAEIRKLIQGGSLAHAAELCEKALAANPDDLALQAVRFEIEELLRQEKSGLFLELRKQLDAEPDLDRGMKLLDEAIAKFPTEAAFKDLAATHRRRRDLVNSIAVKARQCEEQNALSEALSQWNTLRSIHPRYPGLEFEIERLERRIERQKREDEKLQLVTQIDQSLQHGEADRALALVEKALCVFPDDPELLIQKRLATEALERGAEALRRCRQAEELVIGGRNSDALELLREAHRLDDRNTLIEVTLVKVLVEEARSLHLKNWSNAELLVEEALSIDPEHRIAQSLRSSILASKRIAFVDECLAQARQLQLAGELDKALTKVQEGLASYPRDTRLLQLQTTIRTIITEQNAQRRDRDLGSMRRICQEAKQTPTLEELNSLIEQSTVLFSKYPDDADFSSVNSEIKSIVKPLGSAEERHSRGSVPNEVRAADPVEPSRPPSKLGKSLLKDLSIRYGSYLDRVRPVLRSTASILVGIPRYRYTITAIALLLVAVLIGFILRPVSHKPRIAVETANTYPVSIVGTTSGATVKVDDQAVESGTISLSPGTHSMQVSELGFKTFGSTIEVKDKPQVVDVKLEPEPLYLRVVSELPSAQILLDGNLIGSLQDGNFSHPLIGSSGSHVVEVRRKEAIALKLLFSVEDGKPAHLTAPIPSQTFPVVVVSELGNRAIVYASQKGSTVGVTNEDAQPILDHGREVTLTGNTGGFVYRDSSTSIVLPIENSNAPILSVHLGTAPKGVLQIATSVAEATVVINGVKRRKPVRSGKWTGQLDPGEYRVKVFQDGYDDVPEQRVSIVAGTSASLNFELSPAAKSAFLRVEGGTPDSAILVDHQKMGTLSSDGTFGPVPIAADADHLISLQKDDSESIELHRRASVKQTVLITGAQARLKPFGKLTFDVSPPETKITIRRSGETQRVVASRSISVPEGLYLITASANDYENQEVSQTVTSGKSTFVQVKLAKHAPPPPTKQHVLAVNQLFDHPELWKQRDDGFWTHSGVAWMKEPTFVHTLDFASVKKSFNRREKVSWRIYFQGSDYIECEIDGTNYSRREVVADKPGVWVRHPHQLGPNGIYRMRIRVGASGVSVQLGKVSDTLTMPIEGRTALDGKIAMQVIE